MSEETVESVETVTCRKCSATLPADMKYCPDCGAPQHFDRVPIIFGILLVLSSVLLLGSSYITVVKVSDVNPNTKIRVTEETKAVVETAPKDASEGAYWAARRFITEAHPESIAISDFQNSSVQKSGNVYFVTISVDSDQGGNQMRNLYRITLALDQGRWRLQGIQ